MSRYGGYWDFYGPSQPIAARGGIKSQSKRGTFGESWWAKRWMAVLDSYDIGARLSRGRSYARNGQVLSIDVASGIVTAAVQGSRPKPYKVTLSVKTLTEPEWEKLGAALSREALFAAKLLAGEMPPEIENVFKEAGLSLFPERSQDIVTECSCPDWSNPCKHVAAVYCLLGEEFDRNPFLIFQMRGLSREGLIQLLASSETAGSESPEDATPAPLPPEPLAADHAAFWDGKALPEDLFGEVRLPPVAAALPKRLGSFPFWRGSTPFLDAVTPVYVRAGRRGLDVFLCEDDLRGREDAT